MVVTIFLASLLGAMALGMPIAFALMVCGIALMLHMDMFDAQLIAQNTIDGADNFVLMAVPFFMLAGEFMNAGGLSRRIVNLAMALVGHIRGGLGYVAVIAAVIRYYFMLHQLKKNRNNRQNLHRQRNFRQMNMVSAWNLLILKRMR